MSEKKILSTITEIRRSLNSLGIYTYYSGSLKSIVAFITNAVKTINGVHFLENQEGFTVTGFNDINFYIDSNGDLIITSNDDKNFYINEFGELIVEYEE